MVIFVPWILYPYPEHHVYNEDNNFHRSSVILVLHHESSDVLIRYTNSYESFGT